MPNIFQKVFSSVKALPKKFSADAANRWSMQFGGRYAGFLKKKDYMDEYKNWVYACVNQRAKAVSSIKLVLKRGDETIDSSEIIDLINSVNKGTTKSQLFFTTQAFKDLDGNAYWYLARENDGKGKIKEIHILQPNKMAIVANKDNPLEVFGYVYTQQDGTKVPFTPKEILHFKNFNPNGYYPFPHKGMSVVEGAQWAIDTDNEIRTWNYSFFKNGARPDGILSTDSEGSLDEDAYKRIREAWTAMHQGSDNAYKTAILEGGMTWTKIGESQSELDFAAQKELNRDEIASIFEVPKFLIGVTDSINRATAEAATYVFSMFTVKPLMQQLVDTLNEFLLPEFGEDLHFEFVSPVSEDRASILEEYKAGFGLWLTRNDIRKRESLPLTTEGDQFLQPFNLVLGDKVIPEKEKKAIEKPVVKDTSKMTPAEKAVESFVAKMPKAKSKGLSIEAKSAFKLSWKALIDAHTGAFKKKLTKYFNEQEKEVLANLKTELRGLEAPEFKLKGLEDFLFDEDEAISAGISLVTPYIREYLKAGGQDAAKLTGQAFDDSNARISKFVTERASYFAKTITETTIEDLQTQIKEGIAAGESIDDISARVAGVYDKATDYRTDMIARTEVSASANFGAVESYTQADVKQLEWTVVSPEDVDCLENEGVVVKIGDEFPSGDRQPPVHPNCVCGLLPVFDNE